MNVLVLVISLLGLIGSAYGQCTTSYTVENTTTGVINVGQSWLAPYSGMLTSITVKADTPNAGLMTTRIYNGQSVAAPDLLHMQTGGPALVDGENVIPLTASINVVGGQQYTFLLTNESANAIRVRYDSLNGYPCGQATAGGGFVASSDVWFRLGIGPLGTVPALSGLGVSLLSLSILLAAVLRFRRGG